jgi:alpha/beta hydrolase fold
MIKNNSKLNRYALFILATILFFSCETQSQEMILIKGTNYELVKSKNQKAVLILFPCYPCAIEDTKREAFFLRDLEKEGITILLLDLNRKLYLTDEEQQNYAKILNNALDSNKIDKQNVFIGGFSSGGNIAILLSNYLLKTKNAIEPKGVFAVDSPLDLEHLYNAAKNNIKLNANKDAYNEGVFIAELFEEELGKPTENLEKYKRFSPFLISVNYSENIAYLKNIKIRLYTEPDLEWHKKNRNKEYEDLNAYVLEKTNEGLVQLGNKKTEFIKTQNRGIRANGEKHPHSWNIVEKQSLLDWIKE